MKTIKILKLGVMVTDKVSNIEGMLTHLTVDMEHNLMYIFQPKGLNPKTKQPVDRIWINSSRIIGAQEIEVDLPIDIIGTKAEDIATGFDGTIVSLDYHINGCVHVDIKPEGVLEESGNTIDSCNFDIRRIRGEAIKPLDEKELAKSIKEKPSPEKMPSRPNR